MLGSVAGSLKMASAAGARNRRPARALPDDRAFMDAIRRRRSNMIRKQTEGDNRQRRAAAREAREHGKDPSEVGATTGASKQRTEADENATHQERLDLKREGKQKVIRQNTPEARPGSRDADTLDRERHPRMEP
jgi:hypothetical protein